MYTIQATTKTKRQNPLALCVSAKIIADGSIRRIPWILSEMYECQRRFIHETDYPRMFLSFGFRESRIGIGPFPFTNSQKRAQSKSETFLARLCSPINIFRRDTFCAFLLQFYCLRVYELIRDRHAFHAYRYVRVITTPIDMYVYIEREFHRGKDNYWIEQS